MPGCSKDGGSSLFTDTLAAVLRQDIEWSALPASVRRLLARCRRGPHE